jgi:hypothetical protein
MPPAGTAGASGMAPRREPDAVQRKQQVVVHDLAAELGEEPANVSLAWLLHNPVVTAPIIGPRTGEQLEQTLRCTELKLEQSVLDRRSAAWFGGSWTFLTRVQQRPSIGAPPAEADRSRDAGTVRPAGLAHLGSFAVTCAHSPRPVYNGPPPGHPAGSAATQPKRPGRPRRG